MEKNNSSERGITLSFGQTTSNAVISKVILLVLLGGVIGHFQSKNALRQLEKADKISIEKCSEEVCINEVSEYKDLLASDTDYANPVFAIPAMAIGLLIVFGLYELVAILIGLMVKKIIR
ncbi:MAG: hypothetical protein HC873_15980 [Leptolyngbyaceae cyanobacterium SL_1_1]|nr:hypothetical protein [Leptolyngbyaceae cyanobacterium SL_1_1]